MSQDALRFFASYIEKELGIIYSEHNSYQLQNRLEEIARVTGALTIEALHLEQLQNGITGSFKQLLLDIATNNETSFFRDPKTFQALKEIILKNKSDLISPSENLRVWSAASSTGQEALSLAMLLEEVNEIDPLRFSILGTDISERVLKKAQSATYSQLEIQRGLLLNHLNKYFRQNEQGQWEASRELTKHIEFKKANLKEPFLSLGKFHIVLCRNVLIYQNVEGKKEIISRILHQMEPNGFLILGAGETLYGISEDFDQIRCDGVVLYKKKTSVGIAS